MKSPLAAFAAVALYQVVMYTVSTNRVARCIAKTSPQLYFAAYSLTLAYATTSNAGHIITIISRFKILTFCASHGFGRLNTTFVGFTLSLLSPVASAVRRTGIIFMKAELNFVR